MFKNCTLDYLVELVKEDGKTEVGKKLERRIRIVKERCVDFKTLRNKRIAHVDRKTRLHEIDGIDILPGVSLVSIGKAVRSMRKMLRIVAQTYDIVGFRNFEDSFSGTRFGNEVSIGYTDFNYLIACLKTAHFPMPHEMF